MGLKKLQMCSACRVEDKNKRLSFCFGRIPTQNRVKSKLHKKRGKKRKKKRTGFKKSAKREKE